jgi:hypothetical protein
MLTAFSSASSPLPAVPHDRLELQGLALQCQDTGRQLLLPQKLDTGRRSRPGGVIEWVLRSVGKEPAPVSE